MKPKTFARAIFTIAIILVLILAVYASCPHSQGGPNYPFYTTGTIINASTNAVTQEVLEGNQSEQQPDNESDSCSPGTEGADELPVRNISVPRFTILNCEVKCYVTIPDH